MKFKKGKKDCVVVRPLGDRTIPEFKNLVPSTKTVMVYTNFEMNLRHLYYTLPPCKARLDKDNRIIAPYGGIINKKVGDNFEGLETKMKKTKKTQKVKNVLEHFLNQVSIRIQLKKYNVHIMVFKDSFKIAGCKTKADAIEAVRILWEEYICPISLTTSCFHFKDPREVIPKMIFKTVMRNIDFSLGFPIDRIELNNLMNDQEYMDKVHLSQFEPTSQKNVNIKMYSRKPQGYTYLCIIYPPLKSFVPGKEPLIGDEKDVLNQRSPAIIKSPTNIIKSKKKKKQKYTTFIVFASSKIILSGRYVKKVKELYYFFFDLVLKNRKLIEESVSVNPRKLSIGHIVK